MGNLFNAGPCRGQRWDSQGCVPAYRLLGMFWLVKEAWSMMCLTSRL